ncbi:VOC family protein [Svornostia abyssi]|uniref:VOC family protein n=1 Tax=Svornostia abyssi TaxID=2898438 RepID=A0ABY5PH16_9ACTN|nr:VOC family protein [Parviterribacteraceae bacterium J379]
MVTRVGHIALHVADLDRAVDFQQQVIGMVETERAAGVSYLTCNDRHHELILVEDRINRGYEHLAMEVADAAALEGAARRLQASGGTLLGGIYDGEPGIDRALKVQSPNGHVYKLFCGMETVDAPPPGDRAEKFEHISTKVRNMRAEERFLREGLGFRFSDRMGFLASWWHCDEDHHGLALTLAPRPELSHYAYTWPDFGSLGRTADRVLAARGRKCIWGPSRHGPGNNHFLYFHDEDGAMIECCSELAQMQADGYQPRTWSMHPKTINQWGSAPPLRFLLTGFPIAEPTPGRPSWAMAPGRSLEAVR